MSWTVADAFDYKGFPADRSKTGGWVPAALILGLLYLLALSSLLLPMLRVHVQYNMASKKSL